MRHSSDSQPQYRLAIVSTHPIQYNSSWFQAMQRHPRLDPIVFYCHQATPQDQARAGFGVEFDWDVPLLEGYSYRFLENVAARPGFHFRGIDTPEIAELVSKGRFHAVLILGWNFKGAWQALRACRSTNTLAMVRSDSQLRGPRSLWKRILKWLPYHMFIPRLDACVAVGTRSREYFLHYGAHPDRVFEVSHSLGTHWFSELPSQEEKATMRAQAGFTENAVVFIFVGKLEPTKRPLDFLRAAARLPHSDVEVLLVGDGILRAECQDFCKQVGLDARFLGFVNQSKMIDTYVLGDVLVLPSGGETWGLVVNEAMARGLPGLVSEEVGSAPDMVINGGTGTTFECGNIGSLEEKMRDCLKNQNALAEMGRQARRRAECYQPEGAAQQIVEMLLKLSREDL